MISCLNAFRSQPAFQRKQNIAFRLIGFNGNADNKRSNRRRGISNVFMEHNPVASNLVERMNPVIIGWPIVLINVKLMYKMKSITCRSINRCLVTCLHLHLTLTNDCSENTECDTICPFSGHTTSTTPHLVQWKVYWGAEMRIRKH